MHNYECKIIKTPALLALVMSTATLPLAPQALYQQVAERLRDKIFQRALPPGAWIDEMALCGEYGISRTPLREALKVLEAEGLVTLRVRRGAYVTEMSAQDIAQVYHLLGLLESDAAAVVATSASATQRRHLEALHEQLEKQVDHRDEFFAINEAFHHALLEAAGNRWTQQIVTDLRKVMKLSRHHSLFKQGRIHHSLQEHRALMQAIEAQDGEAARQRMLEHFRSGLEAVV
jgi:DNA-binding GntR family transcriptional regulator